MASGLEDAGFEIRDCIMWVFGSGFPKSHNLKDEWDGWGTALKPAWEPIVVARKPLIGTVAANVAVHGTGAINIDGCRIEIDPSIDDPRLGGNGDWASDKMVKNVYEGGYAGVRVGSSALGRWPANLIHDGCEEVLAAFPDARGQMGAVGPQHGDRPSINTYGDWGARPDCQPRLDTGSAARFFYCAKTSRKDRNEGCEAFDKKPLNWSSGTQNPGSFQSDGTDKSSQNNHPTVKPTALMRYLVRLVTPPEGTVLDPFMGSGSTGKACAYEGFNFVGIEREQDYVRISEARIAFAVKDQRESSAQMGMAL